MVDSKLEIAKKPTIQIDSTNNLPVDDNNRKNNETINPVLILCAAILSSYAIQAQSITPTKSTVEHNEHLRPCIIVHLEPETRTLKKAWVKFLKKEYDLKLKGAGFLTNKELLSAEKVVVEKLSFKEMDFYTYIVEDEKGSEMNVFVSFGYDIYVNEVDYPNEFQSMNDILAEFLRGYLPGYYNDKIKSSSKKVNSLKKEINSLTKDINKNSRKIEEHKEDAIKLNTEVSSNQEKLRSAEGSLSETEEKLKSIKAELKKL